ncbi:MAG: hypothetical protein KBG15_10845 [Kofleriaceae bacterium]|nr:hypothetical protein [Kofleriaceae bacterium]
MQLLDLLDRRSWLVVAALGLVGGSYGLLAMWPCSAASAPAVEPAEAAMSRSLPGCTILSAQDLAAIDAVYLHRAMQRRDSLPDQKGPSCALVTMGSPEQTTATLVAAPLFYACDDRGCEPVAAPSATQTLQHCDNGLPQQFLLRSEFHASQWQQLWCDDLGSIAVPTSATPNTVNNGATSAVTVHGTPRMFACVPTVAEPGADLSKSSVPPSRLIRRSNRNVAPPVKLEALSR